MVKQALKSSGQVILICFAECIGLQDHAFWLTTNRTLLGPKYGVNFHIQNHASISKLLYQCTSSWALQIKGGNVWDQESYKLTTKGQGPWLGIHGVWMEWVLPELSNWTYHSCCFLTRVQQGAALCQPHDSTPTGICSNGKQIVHGPQQVLLHTVLSLEMRVGLWPGWGWRGGDERESVDSETVKKTGVHLSEWNSSWALNDDMCFLLEWGKEGAGWILVSPKSGSQNSDLNASK